MAPSWVRKPCTGRSASPDSPHEDLAPWLDTALTPHWIWPVPANPARRPGCGVTPHGSRERGHRHAVRVLPRRRTVSGGQPALVGVRRTQREGRNRLPASRRRRGGPGLPDSQYARPLQVLSHATYSCRGVRTSTESTYYTPRSGSGAFNAGTLRWTCALRGYCHPDRMSPSTQSGSPGKSRGTYFGSSPRGPLHAEIPQLTTSAGSTCHEWTSCPRVRASDSSVEPTDTRAPQIAAVCRPRQ